MGRLSPFASGRNRQIAATQTTTDLSMEVLAIPWEGIDKFIFVPHVPFRLSPRQGGSISPENGSYQYQHSQDFQPSQKHSNGQ
ncbi:hypothetical protein D3C84_395010 [compost metagenome]